MNNSFVNKPLFYYKLKLFKNLIFKQYSVLYSPEYL